MVHPLFFKLSLLFTPSTVPVELAAAFVEVVNQMARGGLGLVDGDQQQDCRQAKQQQQP